MIKKGDIVRPKKEWYLQRLEDRYFYATPICFEDAIKIDSLGENHITNAMLKDVGYFQSGSGTCCHIKWISKNNTSLWRLHEYPWSEIDLEVLGNIFDII